MFNGALSAETCPRQSILRRVGSPGQAAGLKVRAV
jgi:hypothetical protein